MCLREHPSDTHQRSKKHAKQNSRDYFLWSLTPKLTGAVARSAEGTNTGHENAEGMACVGVRVERPVRLASVGAGFGSHDPSFFREGNDLLARSIKVTAFSKDEMSVVGSSCRVNAFVPAIFQCSKASLT